MRRRERITEAFGKGVVGLVCLLLLLQSLLFCGELYRRWRDGKRFRAELSVPEEASADLPPGRDTVQEPAPRSAAGFPEKPEKPARPAGSGRRTGVAESRPAGIRSLPEKERDSEDSRRPAEPPAFRRTESFAFDPNLASAEEFVRLGLSPRQAAVILRWREKGGFFWEKRDFARMYPVSDSLFRRLEPYISIHVPDDRRLELNRADSAALDALPGIGPYYAGRILGYRDRLGGFVSVDQLLEAGLDTGMVERLRPRVRCDTALLRRFSLDADDGRSLAAHPYIGSYAASSLLRLRRTVPVPLTLEEAVRQGAIPEEAAARLKPYVKNFEKNGTSGATNRKSPASL